MQVHFGIALNIANFVKKTCNLNIKLKIGKYNVVHAFLQICFCKGVKKRKTKIWEYFPFFFFFFFAFSWSCKKNVMREEKGLHLFV